MDRTHPYGREPSGPDGRDPSGWQYRHDWRTDRRLYVTVVEALQDHLDAGDQLEPPLFESVDPESLDRLLAGATDACVAFRYRDYHVTVHSNGGIDIARS
ncbi:MAG: HalOD1 output domain-containing protein [Salinigranum sp.]